MMTQLAATDVARRRPDLTRLKPVIDFAPRWTLTETIDDVIARERRGISSRIRYVVGLVAAG